MRGVFAGLALAAAPAREQVFVAVIADAYLAGVSTRRVEKLVQQLGVEPMSRSHVSRLAKSLDRIVDDFRTRPLDGAPYPYLVLDALEVKCREGGRTVNARDVHAVGVNRDGFRESLGLDVVTREAIGSRALSTEMSDRPGTRSRVPCGKTQALSEIFAGLDWRGQQHQLCVIDGGGERLLELRVAHDRAGPERMAEQLAALAPALPVALERADAGRAVARAWPPRLPDQPARRGTPAWALSGRAEQGTTPSTPGRSPTLSREVPFAGTWYRSKTRRPCFSSQPLRCWPAGAGWW